VSYGTVTIGGIPFREELDADADGSGNIRIGGQEAHPPRTRAHVSAAHANLSSLAGLIVPVTFTDKAELSAFYRVSDASSAFHKWAGGAVQTATWSATLERIGADRDVEVESRVPLIGRLTDLATAPVFWHAPAAAALSYFTGSTVPAGSVDRASAEGTVRAYLGLSTAAPRWSCPVEGYLLGSARLVLDGERRIGLATQEGTAWEVSNGLVRVLPGPSGTFLVACWAGAWESEKAYKVVVSGAALTDTPELTVLRNDPEEVAIRLTYPGSPGRTSLDLSLRRGSRFVTGLVKRQSAATMRIERTTTETAAAVTGGLRASAADADGNRFVMGSARTVTTTTSPAAIIRATQPTLDFFIGHEVGAPAAGDAYADLLAQYLGSTGERARIVRR